MSDDARIPSLTVAIPNTKWRACQTNLSTSYRSLHLETSTGRSNVAGHRVVAARPDINTLSLGKKIPIFFDDL